MPVPALGRNAVSNDKYKFLQCFCRGLGRRPAQGNSGEDPLGLVLRGLLPRSSDTSRPRKGVDRFGPDRWTSSASLFGPGPLASPHIHSPFWSGMLGPLLVPYLSMALWPSIGSLFGPSPLVHIGSLIWARPLGSMLTPYLGSTIGSLFGALGPFGLPFPADVIIRPALLYTWPVHKKLGWTFE